MTNSHDVQSEAVLSSLADRLCAFIRKRVANQADADDILQDSFQAMQQRLETLQNHDRFEAWVYQIVRHKIIDYYRKPKRNQESIDLHEESAGEEQELIKELVPCLENMLPKLPEADRIALEQIDIQQRGIKAFADAQSLSESAAKSRVQRARKKMRTMFQECCQVTTNSSGSLTAIHERSCTHCGPDCQCC